MIKKQFDITDSRDLCHTKQVTAEQYMSILQPSEVSVRKRTCQCWQLTALIWEHRCEHTYQQLPVTEVQQFTSLLYN